MNRLKAYTAKFGLITSKVMADEDQICEAIAELCMYTTVGKVYITNGKQSKQVNYIYTPLPARPIYYIRPDGIKVKSLSIHPANYPMVAHYADGKTKVIDISK